jgi:signal transduction histidine kinase
MDLNANETITADRERIDQALTNLLATAIKYSPRANKIVVTSSTDGQNITVCVQDFGIGIDEDIQTQYLTVSPG